MRFIIALLIASFYLIVLLFIRKENPILYFRHRKTLQEHQSRLSDLSERERVLKINIKAIQSGDIEEINTLIKKKFNECKDGEEILNIN